MFFTVIIGYRKYFLFNLNVIFEVVKLDFGKKVLNEEKKLFFFSIRAL